MTIFPTGPGAHRDLPLIVWGWGAKFRRQSRNGNLKNTPMPAPITYIHYIFIYIYKLHVTNPNLKNTQLNLILSALGHQPNRKSPSPRACCLCLFPLVSSLRVCVLCDYSYDMCSQFRLGLCVPDLWFAIPYGFVDISCDLCDDSSDLCSRFHLGLCVPDL